MCFGCELVDFCCNALNTRPGNHDMENLPKAVGLTQADFTDLISLQQCAADELRQKHASLGRQLEGVQAQYDEIRKKQNRIINEIEVGERRIEVMEKIYRSFPE